MELVFVHEFYTLLFPIWLRFQTIIILQDNKRNQRRAVDICELWNGFCACLIFYHQLEKRYGNLIFYLDILLKGIGLNHMKIV